MYNIQIGRQTDKKTERHNGRQPTSIVSLEIVSRPLAVAAVVVVAVAVTVTVTVTVVVILRKLYAVLVKE